VKNHDDDVGAFDAELKADVATTGGHHDRRAPWSFEVLASAASHDTAPVVTPDDESRFLKVGDHDNALCPIQNFGRYAFVGGVECVLHDIRRRGDSVSFLVSRICPAGKAEKQEDNSYKPKTLHNFEPHRSAELDGAP